MQRANPRRLAGSLKGQALLFAGPRYCWPLGFNTWQVLVQAIKVDVFGLHMHKQQLSDCTVMCSKLAA